MNNHTEHFAAEIASRIATLEADIENYRKAFGTVKRNNGTRLFRKAIGIIFEIIAWLVTISCPILVVVIGIGESETMARLQDNLIGYEPHIASLVHRSFFVMQALVGVIMLFSSFTAYLLTKVRRRNNTVKDLTLLLENTLQATEINLKKAKQTQLEFMEWAVKQGREKTEANESARSN
jgi:hypothetical protein